jgi:hypothetical protein
VDKVLHTIQYMDDDSEAGSCKVHHMVVWYMVHDTRVGRFDVYNSIDKVWCSRHRQHHKVVYIGGGCSVEYTNLYMEDMARHI